MIQKTGIIEVDGLKQFRIIEAELIKRGLLSQKLMPVWTVAIPKALVWSENSSFARKIDEGSTFNIEDMYPVHIFADFGLDQEGNPLPTFGNLKAGDPNPFVVGMEVETHYGIGKVVLIGEGPYIEVLMLGTGSVTSAYGFTTSGHPYCGLNILDINTIFPVTTPKPHTYQFGDKVKVEGLTKPQYVAAVIPGFVLVYNKSEFKKIKNGEGCTAFAAPALRVSHWTEPVTIKLNSEYEATIYPEHVKVGCQEITAENALLAAKAFIKAYEP